ncbi:ent-copalyl diphosphate synthase 1 [Diospyros lotus]|uniref:ent-copalyl diphosphate synthase 1 n=1 Tax=Diospyros lotus TaxID=55363 RepID=UPI00225643C7|nr:ent-copalyl diphosphate synthase 1 [Diospyros lotus]
MAWHKGKRERETEDKETDRQRSEEQSRAEQRQGKARETEERAVARAMARRRGERERETEESRAEASRNLLGIGFRLLPLHLAPLKRLLLSSKRISKEETEAAKGTQQLTKKPACTKMSSQAAYLLPVGFSGDRIAVSSAAKHSKTFLGICWVGPKHEQSNLGVRLQCKAVYRPSTEKRRDVLQNDLPVINWNPILEDDDVQVESPLDDDQVSASKRIKELVGSVKSTLDSMEDGEISASAYDTAWVALVEDINGGGGPQFPASLQWIANNQMPDGSWGDPFIFQAHDRILNTLACVIALRSWNVHPRKSQKGVLFLKENICKLEDETAEHMPIGFEVAFPSLIEMARKLGIEVPEDSPVLQEIYARKNLKLTRIPKDIMQTVPTTLLHSLEGMAGLEWEKLLKLQSPDGSFLFSPSSTAFALIHTKDHNCFTYLSKIVDYFNGAAPNVYPVDLFERIWAVDRLERLGISRFFQPQVKKLLDYVHRYWTEEGICWARNSLVHDIDDTAMGFRLLRLHGHHVSADVFRNFEKGGEFFCFAGQSTQAVTGMFNLYRASQVVFPGEKILEDAKKFSCKFLRNKQASREILDKWIITKDLPGEVEYALQVPWYASLPRMETRFYLEQYGGENDVWIGKTLYRMSYVNNDAYLELAKLDYDNCQAMHQLEWDSMQKWYKEWNVAGECGLSRRRLLLAYYLAAASIFEPERSKERLAWAKTTALVEAIGCYFGEEGSSSYERTRSSFLRQFTSEVDRHHHLPRVTIINGIGRRQKIAGAAVAAGQQLGLVGALLGTLNQISLDAPVAHARDIRRRLRHAWETWMVSGRREAELLVRTITLCGGRWEPEEVSQALSCAQCQRLSDLTNGVCYRLRRLQQGQLPNQVHDKDKCDPIMQIESDMQELVQMVICPSSDGVDGWIKQTFLTVAKAFYYTAHCTPRAIDSHISKVLFERVI